MRMSMGLLNGNEADAGCHNLNHSDMGPTQCEAMAFNANGADIAEERAKSDRLAKKLSSLKAFQLANLDLLSCFAEQFTNFTQVDNNEIPRPVRRGEPRDLPNENSHFVRKRRTASRPNHTGRKSLTESPSSYQRTRNSSLDVKIEKVKEEEEEEEEEAEETVFSLDGLHVTDIKYHTSLGEEDRDNLLTDLATRISNNLEVPQCRTRKHEPAEREESFEDLDDSMFEGRHSKLMCDEKKRKRWDVQRIREQRQIEKLRSRESIDKAAEITINNLKPNVTEKSRFFLSSKVPVAAFGIVLPSTSVCDFALPWKSGSRNRKKAKR